MANDVTITKIIDSSRSAVFHVHLFSDGATGDLTNFTLIDPTFDFDPELKAKPIMTIEEIWYELAGFTAKLQFNYLSKNTPVWTLNGTSNGHVNFSKFGGIKDRSNPLDGNGKLSISTNGFTTVASQGTIIIKVRKD